MPLARPVACRGCPLDLIGYGFSRPDGLGSLRVMIVGEALGASEAKDGLPFRPYAQAGAVLDRCLRRAGFTRDQFTFWNMVACQPPGNKLDGAPYETEAISHCRVHFREVLNRARPSIILALGGVPLRHLTGMAGKKRGISQLRGFVQHSSTWRKQNGSPLPVIASYHPSFIARGASKLIGVLIRDIQFAVQCAQEGVTLETPAELAKGYQLHPTVRDAVAYLHRLSAEPSCPIAYDLETDFSTREADEDEVEARGRITQIQFSSSPREAIVFPWQEPYVGIAKQILALPNPKWGWNTWGFDEKVLEQNGIQTCGLSVDLMRAWGHLQPDLPRGLQYATSFYAPTLPPWKHLSDSAAELYGGLDVDSVQRIGARIFHDLDDLGLRGGFDKQVLGLYPALRRMSARGIPIDREAREAFRTEIYEARKGTGREIQSLVPEALKQCHPAAGYKVNPPPIRAWLVEHGIKFKPKEPRAYPDELKRFALDLGFKCKAFEGQERFYLEKPFLATSRDHVLAYMKTKGHRVPLGFKSRRETTEKKELVRLAQRTGDNFYLKVIEYRELLKISSTYIDGWDIDENDRVHSTILPGPATGQLASRDPNIQNIPKVGNLGDGFRRTITAQSGHKLVEFDYTAFHALTLGYFAQDSDYMRLARLDIHSYLAAWLLGLEGREAWLQLPTLELAGVLREVKSKHKFVRDKKAKPAVLGYGFGLGAKKLYDMNIESYANKKEAQATIEMLDGLFPRTKAFRDHIKDRAARQTNLRSPHEYIRRFYDIYHYREVDPVRAQEDPEETYYTGRNGRTYKRVSGEEGEDAIAFLPANGAFGEIKDRILELEAKGLNEKYRFINTIHDSLLFECPEQLVDECLATVAEIMERPSTVLVDSLVAPQGLRCGIETSIGTNWAGQSKENPLGMASVYTTPLEKLGI